MQHPQIVRSNCTAKKAWLACMAGVPVILRCPEVEKAPPEANPLEVVTLH